MASPPVDPFAALEAQITATIGVEASATALINGFAQTILTDVNNALAGGATATQIATLVTNEVSSLQASATSLSAAVAANPAPIPPTTGGTAAGGGAGGSPSSRPGGKPPSSGS